MDKKWITEQLKKNGGVKRGSFYSIGDYFVAISDVQYWNKTNLLNVIVHHNSDTKHQVVSTKRELKKLLLALFRISKQKANHLKRHKKTR